MASDVNTKMAMEAVRHRLYLSRFAEAEAAKAAKILRDSDEEIAGKLYGGLSKSNLSPMNYSQSRLERISDSIRNTVSNTFWNIFSSLNNSMKSLSSGESKYYSDMLGDIIPDEVLDHFPISEVNKNQLWAATTSKPFQGETLSGYEGILGRDFVSAVERAVGAGIVQGESYDQIIKRIIGSDENGFNGGVAASSARNVAAVARTAVSHVSAEAREAVGEENDDLIDSEKWLSTLDTHTSKLCIVRDNLRYDRKTKKGIGHNVPYGAGPGKLHFCCRSTAVFVIKSLSDLGLDGFDMPKGTRASMNGQVPEDLNYATWMRSLPESELSNIVGVDRASMIKSGKLEPSAMFNDKGEYLTLEQLRDLDRIPNYG